MNNRFLVINDQSVFLMKGFILQRMTVPMMQMGQGTPQQSPIMPQPGGIIRGQIMHMTQPQQLRPVSAAVSLQFL